MNVIDSPTHPLVSRFDIAAFVQKPEDSRYHLTKSVAKSQMTSGTVSSGCTRAILLDGTQDIDVLELRAQNICYCHRQMD